MALTSQTFKVLSCSVLISISRDDHVQGACSTSNPAPSLWSGGSKLKYSVSAFHAVARKHRSISLKSRSYSSFRTALIIGMKPKSFPISAFKGSNQYDYSDGNNGIGDSSEFLKYSTNGSYLQHKSEESSVESPKVQKVLEEPSFSETSEKPKNLEKQIGEIPKAVWCFFSGVDATIKVPVLLLTPLYLAVNIVYGSTVSKELAPLWILGPFVVCLYVKMFLSVCRLYAFCFNQTAKVVKSFLLVCDYARCGKLKEPLNKFIFQPLADLKYMNYNELARRKMRDLQEWLHEIYLDYLACPYHYKTSRFLKMLNF